MSENLKILYEKLALHVAHGLIESTAIICLESAGNCVTMWHLLK